MWLSSAESGTRDNRSNGRTPAVIPRHSGPSRTREPPPRTDGRTCRQAIAPGRAGPGLRHTDGGLERTVRMTHAPHTRAFSRPRSGLLVGSARPRAGGALGEV